MYDLGLAFKSIKEFGGVLGGPPRGGSGLSRGGGGPPSTGGPPSGGGGGGGFPIISANVPFGAPWPSSPWNPWYPPMAPTTPMAPSARKGLLYPIYLVRTNSKVQV